MHSPIVAFPSFLQTHYIRNIAVVLKVSCFNLIFISSGKWHPLWSSFQENDRYIKTKQLKMEKKNEKRRRKKGKIKIHKSHFLRGGSWRLRGGGGLKKV